MRHGPLDSRIRRDGGHLRWVVIRPEREHNADRTLGKRGERRLREGHIVLGLWAD